MPQKNHGSPELERLREKRDEAEREYSGAAEPPVRCGESHLSGLTEPPCNAYC